MMRMLRRKPKSVRQNSESRWSLNLSKTESMPRLRRRNVSRKSAKRRKTSGEDRLRPLLSKPSLSRSFPRSERLI